ncbi:hypothetical protein [Streptomyces malaysiensis]
MTDKHEPIRRSDLPPIPPPESEIFTWFPHPDGGGDMVRGQRQGGVQVRRRVSYGDWEPVRPDHWTDRAERETSATATAHRCGNCDGIDPSSCLANPDRPPAAQSPHAELPTADEEQAAVSAAATVPPVTRAYARYAESAEALRWDLYDDLDAFARQTQAPGLQHAQIRDHLAVFLTEGLLRRMADEAQPSAPAATTTPSPLPALLATLEEERAKAARNAPLCRGDEARRVNEGMEAGLRIAIGHMLRTFHGSDAVAAYLRDGVLPTAWSWTHVCPHSSLRHFPK